MIAYNGRRLNIWMTLTNPCDYNEFTQKCAAENIVPMNVGEFAQKVGMLLVARAMYPDLQLPAAYIQLTQLANTSGPGPGVAGPGEGEEARKNCGGCGGGSVI